MVLINYLISKQKSDLKLLYNPFLGTSHSISLLRVKSMNEKMILMLNFVTKLHESVLQTLSSGLLSSK
jgi:hypothetical protein